MRKKTASYAINTSDSQRAREPESQRARDDPLPPQSTVNTTVTWPHRHAVVDACRMPKPARLSPPPTGLRIGLFPVRSLDDRVGPSSLLMRWSSAASSTPLTASLWLSGFPGSHLRSYAPTRTERRCAAAQLLEKSNPVAAAAAAPAAGHDHGLVLAVWFLLLLQLVGPERPDIPCPTCQPGRLDLHAHLGRYFRPDGRVFGPTDPPGASRSRSPWLPRDNVIAAMAYPSQPRLRTALSSDNPGCLESYSSGRRVRRLCTSAPGRS